MQKYHALPAADRPRVFGMTASPVNLRLSDSVEAARTTIVAEIRELERVMDAKVVTIHDLTEIQMVRPRSHMYQPGQPDVAAFAIQHASSHLRLVSMHLELSSRATHALCVCTWV